MEAARRHYDLAKPRLQSLKSEDLIARCEKILGLLHDTTRRISLP